MASLTCQRWASSFWEMHAPSMGLSFRRCCRASMNALFGDKAKRNVLSQAHDLSGKQLTDVAP